MDGKSSDVRQEQIGKLKELFPEIVSEGKVDWEKLRLTLGEDITIDNERYVLNWAGKSDAFRAIQTPSTATLKPQREQSVEFDSTQNIFIEGENLEVLKVLQKSYYGKVKMVCIDPPYNTGNDSFIYPDKFSESKDEYLRRIGDKDEAGYLTKEGFFRKNSKENGQYHSNWLSMMYPRLFLARNLLRDDGVIFVSIDDNEVHNLRLMMNEIFGEENFLAQLVWEKGRKNDARFFSVGHEYMLVYAHSVALLRERGTIWREPKPGADEVWTKYLELRNEGKTDREVEQNLSQWFKSLPKSSPAKKLSRYKHIDKFGPWRDRDISWPGGGGPRYEVIHPNTHKPCKVPERGWVFSDAQAMNRQIKLGLVEFRDDEKDPPFRKAHLRPIPEELVEMSEIDDPDIEDNQPDEGVGLQVMPSVIYKQSQVAVKYLRQLFGAKIFNNPKDHEVIGRMIKYCTAEEDLLLDCFAGSGTTAQAAMETNKEDGGNRKFILVQLPEKTDEGSEAYKAGYETIADICKERIRRAGQKVKGEKAKDEGLFKGKEVDTGFKVFRLEPSNFKVWRTDTIENGDDLVRQMDAFADPVRAGSDAEAMAWEILVKSGYELTTSLETISIDSGTGRKGDKENVQVYSVAGGEVILALEKISQKAVDEIVKMSAEGGCASGAKPKTFICLDRLFAGNDQLKTNTALQLKDAGVEFRTI